MNSISSSDRRRALRLGYWQAALWSAGTSLTSGPLINFLANDLHAPGVKIGLLQALPALIGILRLLAPGWIRVARGLKPACIGAYVLAYGLSLGLPVVGWIPAYWPTAEGRELALAVLMGVLVAMHLVEPFGNIALWSWLGEYIPRRIRGRYLARRLFWQLCIALPVSIGGSYFTDYWKAQHKNSPHELLLGYSWMNALGAALLLASLVPLFKMPGVSTVFQTGLRWRELIAPLTDRTFRRVLLFRSWFSCANGISQAIQYKYPQDVLKLKAGDLAWMSNTMKVGQAVVSPWLGKLADRGNIRRIMIACQTLVAVSLAFYLSATPEYAWLIAGAYLCWIAYAGHNLAFPLLHLQSAPSQLRPAYIAASDAFASLCYAATSIVGGALFDYLQPSEILNPFQVLLYLGLISRLLAIPLAARLKVPE